MPTDTPTDPLDLDWAEAQAGNPPPWCDGLGLGKIKAMDSRNPEHGAVICAIGTDLSHLVTRHAWSMVTWLWEQGAWLEPPEDSDDCWSVQWNAGELLRMVLLIATTPRAALHEACRLCRDEKEGV